METFYYFIPNGVIAEMGLTTDGQTVSREVRLCDLFAGGQMSANDYHALASAGMVVMPIHIFTFQSVEETADGWICTHLARGVHTTQFLREMFPQGIAWGGQFNLPSYDHPDAEALARAGWARAVRLPLYRLANGSLYVHIHHNHPDAGALALAGWAQAVPLDHFVED